VAAGWHCRECGFSDSSGRDLRARRPKPLLISIPRILSVDIPALLAGIELDRPELCYEGPSPVRDSREFLSVMQSLLPSGGRVLDLGCGPRDQAGPIEHLGYSYVGVDYTNQNADLLADAHSMPFKDASFDCVFSFAVFEHLHDPVVAIQEVARVLKPGGFFIGNLSQGKPFHPVVLSLHSLGICFARLPEPIAADYTAVALRGHPRLGDIHGSFVFYSN
jgi:SAM-dependent methyltransferase